MKKAEIFWVIRKRAGRRWVYWVRVTDEMSFYSKYFEKATLIKGKPRKTFGSGNISDVGGGSMVRLDKGDEAVKVARRVIRKIVK